MLKFFVFISRSKTTHTAIILIFWHLLQCGPSSQNPTPCSHCCLTRQPRCFACALQPPTFCLHCTVFWCIARQADCNGETVKHFHNCIKRAVMLIFSDEIIPRHTKHRLAAHQASSRGTPVLRGTPVAEHCITCAVALIGSTTLSFDQVLSNTINHKFFSLNNRHRSPNAATCFGYDDTIDQRSSYWDSWKLVGWPWLHQQGIWLGE